MDIEQRKSIAGNFFRRMMLDRTSRLEFIQNPVSTAIRIGFLTEEESLLPGVQDYFSSLAQRIGKVDAGRSDGLLNSFWDDMLCVSCKAAMAGLVAAAIAAATLATGGISAAALAEMLGISETAATIAIGATGGAVGELTSHLLKVVCGC